MFRVDEDCTVHVTRGDAGGFTLTADFNEEAYTFRAGDVIRLKVFPRKECDNVVLQKEFDVLEDTQSVEIFLEGDETKFGEVISKPVDYWYELELNPQTKPQTIVGYDENGAKIWRLYPEGGEA